jgi:very-short-patch-repair endonuclease
MAVRGTAFAKTLRRRATDAESLLWRHLRAHRFAGFKFKPDPSPARGEGNNTTGQWP